MKPDWKDAPEWANWLAKDESGDWWWFENPVERCDGGWCWVNKDRIGRFRIAGDTSDWQDSLEARIRDV